MEKQLKILGTICLFLGISATILPFVFSLTLSIPVGFLGLMASTAYVYLDTKNSVNAKKFTIGIWSMILSSVPILLVLATIIMVKAGS
jgi:hypothetical protein